MKAYKCTVKGERVFKDTYHVITYFDCECGEDNFEEISTIFDFTINGKIGDVLDTDHAHIEIISAE